MMYLVFSQSQIVFCLHIIFRLCFFSPLHCFFLFISFLASCKRHSRHKDNSWTMQQIFDRSSLFHLFVTKILSLSLINYRLKALFSLRTARKSKGLDTRNLLLPQGGQIHTHAKHLYIVLCNSLSSD